MTENTMPAAEAVAHVGGDTTSYELAFHVLPTVAEGEVTTVVSALKAEITKFGGTLFDEEAPERVELAYEVVKHLEGRNRKFKSAYFGWMRFKTDAAAIPTMMDEVATMPELLRHLLIKLTRVEEQHPFRFHEAMAAANLTVTTFDLDAEVTEGEETEVTEEVAAEAQPEAPAAEVDSKSEVA